MVGWGFDLPMAFTWHFWGTFVGIYLPTRILWQTKLSKLNIFLEGIFLMLSWDIIQVLLGEVFGAPKLYCRIAIGGWLGMVGTSTFGMSRG